MRRAAWMVCDFGVAAFIILLFAAWLTGCAVAKAELAADDPLAQTENDDSNIVKTGEDPLHFLKPIEGAGECDLVTDEHGKSVTMCGQAYSVGNECAVVKSGPLNDAGDKIFVFFMCDRGGM